MTIPVDDIEALAWAEPFSTAAALKAGMTRDRLRTKRLRAPFPGVRVGSATSVDLVARCRSLRAVMPRGTVVSGLTAAALYGWALPRDAPDELDVTVAAATPRVRRAGVKCHQLDIPAVDICERFGLLITTPLRTLLDLARSLSLIDLVVMADSALRRRFCTTDELAAAARSGRGQRGIRAFRRMAGFADGRSESPMETLMRLIPVLSGLPPPMPQAVIRDEFGGWLAVCDLKAPGVRSVLEYDGADHNEPGRQAADRRRWRALRRAGYEVYPYTARDVFLGANQIVADYREALGLPSTVGDVEGWWREFRKSSYHRGR